MIIHGAVSAWSLAVALDLPSSTLIAGPGHSTAFWIRFDGEAMLLTCAVVFGPIILLGNRGTFLNLLVFE